MSADELSSAPIEIVVHENQADARLDWFLARQFPRYSRTFLRRVINAAAAKVGGKRVKASYRVSPGEIISIVLPDLPREGPEPADIPLEILYEDASLAAINKPPGMVVHPGKGNWRGTLASALQFHFDRLSSLGGPTRPGIVHRLDRDTSGVIVVAKNDRAHQALAQQFEARTVSKEYFAIVVGQPDRDRDLIDLPIGFHPHQREKMAIRPGEAASRPAQSFYEVIERFTGFSSVRVLPKTGRTHQIRVHLAAIGCPVLCDRAYGGRSQLTHDELVGGRLPAGSDHESVLLDRQALHARRLAFVHPDTAEPLQIIAPLPDDLTAVLGELARWRAL
jgi:23S rRNA pseudouridine1911/1915/1917 synthase